MPAGTALVHVAQSTNVWLERLAGIA